MNLSELTKLAKPTSIHARVSAVLGRRLSKPEVSLLDRKQSTNARLERVLRRPLSKTEITVVRTMRDEGKDVVAAAMAIEVRHADGYAVAFSDFASLCGW